jgi:2-oxoglutarate ferredoxin oxidoreductase subunit alpha
MSDQDMAVRVQTVTPFDLSKVFHEPRLGYTPGSTNGTGAYERYKDTPSGVSPMSIPGQAGGQYTAEGLEHYPSGAPVFSVELHTSNMRKRARKLQSALEYIEKHAMWEYIGDPKAEIGIIGWGSTIGPVREAIKSCADDGMAVQAFYPKTLMPLPEKQLEHFLEHKRTVIVPEMNFSGQLAEMLQARFLRPFVKLNSYGGVPFETREIVGAIRDAYRAESY